MSSSARARSVRGKRKPAVRLLTNSKTIVMSYETYALVRDTVRARALGAITVAPRKPLLI